MLDGMQLRPSTYMGGTSSWAQSCSWTQRQLSIKERHPAFPVCTVKVVVVVGVGWGGGVSWVQGVCVPSQKEKGLKRNTPKQEWLLTLKENISFIKILNRKTSTDKDK